MLPARARLTRSEDFSAVMRRGRRAGRRTLVVHVLCREAGGAVDGAAAQPAARVGFIVSRAVGDAVTRNLVKRRLRHLVRDRLERLPAGALVVVRALPPAVVASSLQLGRDLDAALNRALSPSSPGAPAAGSARPPRREGSVPEAPGVSG